MPNRVCFSLGFAVAVVTTPALAAKTAVCIENASDEELVFVAEAHGGERLVRRAAPGDTLCAQAPEAGSKGLVGVFESEDAIEGCSRNAVAGTPERLIDYASFDNCTWAEP